MDLGTIAGAGEGFLGGANTMFNLARQARQDSLLEDRYNLALQNALAQQEARKRAASLQAWRLIGQNPLLAPHIRAAMGGNLPGADEVASEATAGTNSAAKALGGGTLTAEEESNPYYQRLLTQKPDAFQSARQYAARRGAVPNSPVGQYTAAGGTHPELLFPDAAGASAGAKKRGELGATEDFYASPVPGLGSVYEQTTPPSYTSAFGTDLNLNTALPTAPGPTYGDVHAARLQREKRAVERPTLMGQGMNRALAYLYGPEVNAGNASQEQIQKAEDFLYQKDLSLAGAKAGAVAGAQPGQTIYGPNGEAYRLRPNNTLEPIMLPGEEGQPGEQLTKAEKPTGLAAILRNLNLVPDPNNPGKFIAAPPKPQRGAPARAPQQPAARQAAPQTFAQMPDPKQYANRTLRDSTSGKRYKSDGTRWIEVQ